MALGGPIPPPLLRLRSPRLPLLPCLATVNGAAAWSGNGTAHSPAIQPFVNEDQLEQLMRAPSENYHAPTPLPSTPNAATLGALMPYLARLALGEGQLYWRVAGALVALLM